MGMLLVFTLLVILIVPFSSMLTSVEGVQARTNHHWLALAALLVTSIFFGFALFLPADPIDAWGFQAFYGALCVLTVAAASVFIHLEHPRDHPMEQARMEPSQD